MKNTKLTLFVSVLAAALFGMGCASVKITEEQLQSGLVAYYPFNGNAKDASGNANHGKVTGATLTNDKQGQPNGAYSFDDGKRTIIQIPESDGVEGEAHSLSLWINSKPTDQLSTDPVFIAKDHGTGTVGRQWQLFGRRDRRIGANVWGADGLVSLSSKSLHAIGGWTHVLQAWDGQTLKLYINGVLDAQTKAVGPLASGGNPVVIGRVNEFVFKGSMDDVRIYNRALSAEEVKALYNLEKPKGK